MQSQLEGSTLAKDLTPKRLSDDWVLPYLCSHWGLRARPLCTSRVVVAWLLRRPLFLAGSVLAWLPKSILMNSIFQDLNRQKLSKTLPLYFFLLFLEVPFPAPRPTPKTEKVPTQYAGLTSGLGYMLYVDRAGTSSERDDMGKEAQDGQLRRKRLKGGETPQNKRNEPLPHTPSSHNPNARLEANQFL